MWSSEKELSKKPKQPFVLKNKYKTKKIKELGELDERLKKGELHILFLQIRQFASP